MKKLNSLIILIACATFIGTSARAQTDTADDGPQVLKDAYVYGIPASPIDITDTAQYLAEMATQKKQGFKAEVFLKDVKLYRVIDGMDIHTINLYYLGLSKFLHEHQRRTFLIGKKKIPQRGKKVMAILTQAYLRKGGASANQDVDRLSSEISNLWRENAKLKGKLDAAKDELSTLKIKEITERQSKENKHQGVKKKKLGKKGDKKK